MCALSLTKKTEITDSYSHTLREAEMVVLSEYRGSKVSAFDALRNKLRADGNKAFVIKNTLLKRALKETHFGKLSDVIEGPLALVVATKDGGIIALAKALDEVFTDDTSSFRFHAAMSADSAALLPATYLRALAKLPPKEVLLGQLVGVLQSPMYHLVGTLQGVPRSMVCLLSVVSQRSK